MATKLKRLAAIAAMKAIEGGSKADRSAIFQGLLVISPASEKAVFDYLFEGGLSSRVASSAAYVFDEVMSERSPPAAPRRRVSRPRSSHRSASRKAEPRTRSGHRLSDWQEAVGMAKKGTTKRVEQILRAEGVPAPLARSLAGAAVEYADVSSQAPSRAARWAWGKATGRR